MRLVVAPGSREFVDAHGGAVYVWSWSRTIGCCRARTHVLEAATERPSDRELELIHAADGFQIHTPPGLVAPQELHLEVRRGRLRASWNGQGWIG